MNVTIPVTDHSEPLPVMVWIHGGGLACGSPNDYDPRLLVGSGRALLVAVGYRLNIFGFFFHPELESQDCPGGNYGLLDVQFALRWVRENITEFGGDPNRVTIIGESGGASLVQGLLLSPFSEGLFHRAIVQSTEMWTRGIRDLKTANRAAVEFCDTIGVEQTPAGLRSLPIERILAANSLDQDPRGKYSVGLVVDGNTIPEPIVEAYRSGHFQRVPVLRGMNRDECTWFLGLRELNTGESTAPTDYYKQIGLLFPDAWKDVQERYPLEEYESPSNALAAVLTDSMWISGERQCVATMSKWTDVFPYLFDVPDTPIPTPDVSFSYRSSHTAELLYLFPGFHGASGPLRSLDTAQKRLSAIMAVAWTTFAESGRPSLPAAICGPVSWHEYQAETDTVLRLSTSDLGEFCGLKDQHHCDLWNAVATTHPLRE